MSTIPSARLRSGSRGSAQASRRTSSRGRAGWIGWLYLLPAGALWLVFFAVPLGLDVWMSLHDWPLLKGQGKFNAPANYAEIPTNTLFMSSIWFTVRYTFLITVILIVVSLGLAMLVQEGRRRTTGILRTAYFLPVVTGISTAALLFLALLNPTLGPISPALKTLFGKSIDLLAEPNEALWSTITMMTWRFAGFYMIIMLTGLQSIPQDLYESALIDGATRWRTFRWVTLPLLRPTIALCLVLIVSGGLVAFEQFYVLTHGGPNNSTVTMVMAIYREGFTQFNLGTAAALSIVVMLFLVLLNLLQFLLSQRDPTESRSAA